MRVKCTLHRTLSLGNLHKFKMHAHRTTTKKGGNFDLDRSNGDTYSDFKIACGSINSEMVETDVAVEFHELASKNRDGNMREGKDPCCFKHAHNSTCPDCVFLLTNLVEISVKRVMVMQEVVDYYEKEGHFLRTQIYIHI